MQKFNKVTVESNFIKNLLATTYLPLIRTIREGDYIVEDRLYVFKCNIIKCTKSGFIGNKRILYNVPLATYKTIEEYHFGEKNGKLCTNFISSAEGYDYKTHEYLGKYLRNLRDMYGLNLMPFYNCFSNQPLEAHHIEDTRIIQTTTDYSTKIYKVPIRFNTTYTICMENIGVTTFAPAFIKNNKLIKLNNTRFGNGVDITNRYNSLHLGQTIYSEPNLKFKKPITIRFNNIPETKKINYYTNADKDTYQTISFTGNNSISSLDNYFDRVTITEENIDFYKDKNIYKYEDNVISIMNVSNIKYNKIYFIATSSPKYCGWYELNSDVYSLSSDIQIDPTKTYYRKYQEEVTNTKEYNITSDICKMYDESENNLYLLIQVPTSFNTNILVLEGDYTNTESLKIVDEALINSFPDYILDNLYIHDLSLMISNRNEPAPFADTLIQFLLWNALCELDSINNDLDRLQINIEDKMPDLYYFTFTNYWQPRYRQVLSDYAKNDKTKYISDNIGYVTTSLEELLNREQQ